MYLTDNFFFSGYDHLLPQAAFALPLPQRHGLDAIVFVLAVVTVVVVLLLWLLARLLKSLFQKFTGKTIAKDSKGVNKKKPE